MYRECVSGVQVREVSLILRGQNVHIVEEVEK